jgi:hypothetical protein
VQREPRRKGSELKNRAGTVRNTKGKVSFATQIALAALTTSPLLQIPNVPPPAAESAAHAMSLIGGVGINLAILNEGRINNPKS